VMLSGPLVVSTGLPESVAFTVTVDVPAVVGVPLTTQPLSDNPAGSVPAVTAQAYGEVPPATPMVAVYGTPTVAPGSVAKVSVRAAGETVITTGPEFVAGGFPESVTVTVTVDVPGAVGVPVITQPDRVKPTGNVPEAMLQV
jgi:hypothetical protein